MPGPNIVRRNFRQYDKDNGQAGMYAPTAPGWTHSNTGALSTANQARLTRLVPSRNMTVVSLKFAVLVAASIDDPCDVGLYDSALSRLGATGSTAGKLNSTGIKSMTLASPVTIKAGQVYFAAFSYGTVGGTAASLGGASFSTSTQVTLFGTVAPQAEGLVAGSSFPLPASVSAIATGVPIAFALSET